MKCEICFAALHISYCEGQKKVKITQTPSTLSHLDAVTQGGGFTHLPELQLWMQVLVSTLRSLSVTFSPCPKGEQHGEA